MNETQRERAVLVAKLRDRERLLEEARAIIKDFMQDHGDVDEAHTCEWCKPAAVWLAKLGASNQ